MIVATMAVGLGAMILVFDLVVLWPLGLQLVAVLRRAGTQPLFSGASAGTGEMRAPTVPVTTLGGLGHEAVRMAKRAS